MEGHDVRVIKPDVRCLRKLQFISGPQNAVVIRSLNFDLFAAQNLAAPRTRPQSLRSPKLLTSAIIRSNCHSSTSQPSLPSQVDGGGVIWHNPLRFRARDGQTARRCRGCNLAPIFSIVINAAMRRHSAGNVDLAQIVRAAFSVSKGASAKAVENCLHRHKIAAGVNRQLLSFCAQVIPPELFALNATNGAISKLFLCRTIIDHWERKPVAQIPENAKPFNCLTSGPKRNLLKAISRQICPG